MSDKEYSQYWIHYFPLPVGRYYQASLIWFWGPWFDSDTDIEDPSVASERSFLRWSRRYKPLCRDSGLISYRVNFLFFIGLAISWVLCGFIYGAVLIPGPLIQGFSMADITLYIIMSFVTNLLTRSDSSFMIGDEVKDGSIIMRLLRPVHLRLLTLGLVSKWLIFISVGLPF